MISQHFSEVNKGGGMRWRNYPRPLSLFKEQSEKGTQLFRLEIWYIVHFHITRETQVFNPTLTCRQTFTNPTRMLTPEKSFHKGQKLGFIVFKTLIAKITVRLW